MSYYENQKKAVVRLILNGKTMRERRCRTYPEIKRTITQYISDCKNTALNGNNIIYLEVTKY